MSQQQQEIYYNDMAKNIRNPAQPCTGSSNSNEEHCHGHMDARLQNPQNLEPAVHRGSHGSTPCEWGKPATGPPTSIEEGYHGKDPGSQPPQKLEPAVHHSGTPHGLGSEPATDNFEEQAGLGCRQGVS